MAHRRTPIEARTDLARWRAALPGDPFADDVHLVSVNRRHLDADRLETMAASAGPFGQRVVTELVPLVAGYQAHPPRLDKYDGIGEQVEQVVFDGDYHRAGRVVWESGLLAHGRHPGGSFEQANLTYLLSLEGEMGHMCAATCTNGLIRVLRWAGDDEPIDRYLDALASAEPDALRGAQYLTEVQGGSDVGANVVTARQIAGGRYRLQGEKWFCSVADADLFLVMARVGGAPGSTSGLGCFLVPRLVDGRPNGFSIRRLKDKLGTVSMASGEIDFVDALAQPVGDPEEGFKLMVGAMLNTSRWMNALGNVGIMRRAHLEARAYAAERRAFGRAIGEFPAVQQMVAGIKVEWLAALHSTWALTALDEIADHAGCGEPPEDPDDLRFHRFLVNANKLVTSQACTDVVRSAIEVLGGNGVIESFSVLPRLLRDSLVYEQWEGTHNVLAAQVARDMAKLDLLPVVVGRIEALLDTTDGDDRRVRSTLTQAEEDGRRCLTDTDAAAWHFRSVLVRLHRIYQAALLLASATDEPGLADELEAAALLLLGRHVEPGYRPEDDPSYPKLITTVIGDG